ncbi:hypothetical protein GvMRE_I2g193 [endosymbiont GvMRE of Glomus versiforme]|nr:hypothetical protein GvMRE_I2g193 [endosymbiont GvMRE of Glomus versiforme]
MRNLKNLVERMPVNKRYIPLISIWREVIESKFIRKTWKHQKLLYKTTNNYYD